MSFFVYFSAAAAVVVFEMAIPIGCFLLIFNFIFSCVKSIRCLLYERVSRNFNRPCFAITRNLPLNSRSFHTQNMLARPDVPGSQDPEAFR